MKRRGDPIEQRIAYHWNVRNGKGVRVQAYFSWEEALEAVGLREQSAWQEAKI